MLTESDVTRKWRTLFNGGSITAETIKQAQGLIDDLPLESPLRIRLGNELGEIRNRLSGKLKRR